MFNFRLKTDVPGFRVGETEDTPGFALDPSSLAPTWSRYLNRHRLLYSLRLLETCDAKGCEVGAKTGAIGEAQPRIAWKVAIYA